MGCLETLYFDDFVDFISDAMDKFDELNSDFKDVSFIAKYDEATEIIKQLICLGHNIESINIHDEDYEYYSDEFIITLTDNSKIYCEEFKRENGYFNDNSSITFVSNNCNSACIKHVESDIVYAFAIGEKEDLEDGNKNTDGFSESIYISKNDDGIAEGFTKSWTNIEGNCISTSIYSFYSNNSNELNEIAGKFGIKL